MSSPRRSVGLFSIGVAVIRFTMLASRSWTAVKAWVLWPLSFCASSAQTRLKIPGTKEWRICSWLSVRFSSWSLPKSSCLLHGFFLVGMCELVSQYNEWFCHVLYEDNTMTLRVEGSSGSESTYCTRLVMRVPRVMSLSHKLAAIFDE